MKKECDHYQRESSDSSFASVNPKCESLRTNDTNRHDSISAMIDVIWGNQGIYANKLKDICSNLSSSLLAWFLIPCQSSTDEDSETSITKDQLKERMLLLPNSVDQKDFETGYNHLKEMFSKFVAKTKPTGQEVNAVKGALQKITDNITLFEASLDAVKIHEHENVLDFNEGNFVHDREFDFIEIQYLDALAVALDSAFKKVQTVTLHHSIMSINNCNFEPGKFNYLKPYANNNADIPQINIFIAVQQLDASNTIDYDNLFIDDFEEHVVLFFECLWTYMECITSTQIEVSRSVFTKDVRAFLDNWLVNIHVDIDREKYNLTTDMTQLYLNARKILKEIVGSLD